MPAPAPTFSVGTKTITFPSDVNALPGMSPAAVSRVLDIIERHAVDPNTVDVVKANMAGARFAIEVSNFSVAETLRRLDKGADIQPYLDAVSGQDADFEANIEAFALVVKRNPKVFNAKKNAPAEPPTGN